MSRSTPGTASNSPQTLRDSREFLARRSFVELNARERAQALLDEGSYRELLGPFERLESPWLLPQGVVPQADDGLIVARGEIGGTDSVILAIEGQFQGGGIGEVSGAKVAAALDLALEDAKKGHPVQVVLVLETGGVRLQEANLGLEAIAEINSSLIALRQHVPVIGVIAGMVGCFGGMSITASLCSYLIMTRQARLGLNGPEVIEEQSGIEEFDSQDRQLIWGVNGGEQRHATGFADYLAEDDVEAIKECIVEAWGRGIPATHRSEQVDDYLRRLAAIDVSRQFESSEMRELWSKGK
ncbi:MAG TPA: biotin-independent malonate decarboxylase subunit beta [Chthoniobacterales bacterium]|nr:biotin-independent malonate decarboxylase subunit beta [Chthoniobacterales bacterium]